MQKSLPVAAAHWSRGSVDDPADWHTEHAPFPQLTMEVIVPSDTELPPRTSPHDFQSRQEGTSPQSDCRMQWTI